MRVVKVLLLLGTLLVALPPLPAQATDSPRQTQTICIHVHASIKPRPVHVGDDMFLYGNWQNCGRSAYMRFLFGLRVPRHCEGWGVHTDFHYRLHKGEGFGDIVFSTVDCAGVYRLTAKAYHDGVVIGRSTTWVRVLP
jgi:hypothetical protein